MQAPLPAHLLSWRICPLEAVKLKSLLSVATCTWAAEQFKSHHPAVFISWTRISEPQNLSAPLGHVLLGCLGGRSREQPTEAFCWPWSRTGHMWVGRDAGRRLVFKASCSLELCSFGVGVGQFSCLWSTHSSDAMGPTLQRTCDLP